MRETIALLTTSVLLVLLSACSGVSNPVESDQFVEESKISTTNPENTSYSRYDGVFGAWMVHADINRLTAEIIPARNADVIGDIFDADLSQFLTVSPCSNCLTISRVGFDGYGDLEIDLTMKHPFDNITTRPDLHGFDVRAIFLFEQSGTTTYDDINMMHPDGTEEACTIGDFFSNLLNPDGYTSHFDSLVTDPRYFINGMDIPGNLNPYLRYFDNTTALVFDPHAPDGHNVMPVGSSNYTRTAKFDLDNINDELNFYIIADCAYGHSAVLANRSNPQYYLPSFHRTESWRVEYYFENHDIGFAIGSTTDLMVQVFDWQHGATVDPAYPDPANLSGIRESSDVLEVQLSMPGFSDTLYTSSTPESGTGAPDDPLIYRLTVTNENGGLDNQVGLLAVRDQLYGQASPSGRMPIPVTPSGFPYDTPDIRDYALYVPVSINVNEDMMGPWGYYMDNFEIFIPEIDMYANEGRTTLHPTFHMDQGHEKFLYAWDSDYDGVTFDIEAVGLPSPEVDFTSGGRKDVGFRVTTNTVPTQEYVYTLPVYAEGAKYENVQISQAAQQYSTSMTKNHSIGATQDNYYVAYIQEVGGQRDIYLAIVDKHTGDIQRVQVTDTALACYSPSICVSEWGSSPGVYIAYCQREALNSIIFTTWGNLDGTGFDPGNIRRVTTDLDPFEYRPCLLNISSNETLLLYYQVQTTGPVSSILYGTHSDDWGDTWMEDGRIADNGSDFQQNLTFAASAINVYIFWEDYINVLERGSDIWTAMSNDGIGDFGGQRIFSVSSGAELELFPSAVWAGGNTAVAYVLMTDITEPASIYVTIQKSGGALINYRAVEGRFSTTYTQPSIHCDAASKFILACGEYNTTSEELSAQIYEVRITEAGSLVCQNLYDYPVGTISPSAANIYPAVYCDASHPYCVENFVVWRDFTNGSTTSTVEPVLTFGEIAMTSFITDEEFMD